MVVFRFNWYRKTTLIRWFFNRRIKEYGFVENQDFVIISEISETMTKNGQRRATTSKQYHITVDMAKELAMVEKNAKGREIRRYFIQMEKQVLQSAQSITAQITQTSLTLQHVEGNLSNAGRYLVTHGKKTKPQLKAKLAELLAKAQPFLPFVEFK